MVNSVPTSHRMSSMWLPKTFLLFRTPLPGLLARTLLVAVSAISLPAAAYGPDGHHTIGAIADRLIVGTNAATQVNAILGGLSLENAAVWADCAKGVNATTLKYVVDPRFPECAIYESPEGQL